VNYPATDLATLDNAAGLASTAAKSIITARNGADGVIPSGDDFFFTSVAQVDAVPNVGDAALTKLAAYAAAHPAPASVTVKTVLFKGWQAEAVVWGVNTATKTELDALLDSRAVTSLMNARPVNSVTQIGGLAYLGTTALTALQRQSQPWWAKEHGSNTTLAGTFDGVTFDEKSAATALEIANRATLNQMSTNGVPAAPAAAIVGNRPYSTLAQVAAVGGVGTATMKGLLAYAQSGKWGSASSCIDTFSSAVGPHLPDLLLMSESDRPLNLVSFPGAGAQAATGASLMALVGAPAGSTFEQRDPTNFTNNFEPASSSADPNAAAAVTGAFAVQLMDVVYIAIIPPANSPDRAQVDVYLVGRTSCGDLVGLHAISIET
jgi:DNA uptake protein ComE-like DNA-binding protein